MNITRHLDPELIKLHMTTPVESGVEDGPQTGKQRRDQKEKVLDELVGLLELSGKVSNRNNRIRHCHPPCPHLSDA